MRWFVGACAVCAGMLYAQESMESIEVETSLHEEKMEGIYGEEIKSVDTADALFQKSASAWMVRRSAISNDVIIRGMKKDNINVTIDGMKIYGACPNRMDPPFSHIFTNNIEAITIQKGPFSVEDFGILGSHVAIETVVPKKGFGGEVDVGIGSWGYQKGALRLYGGDEKVRFLLSGSTERSQQYVDGEGNRLWQQIEREIKRGTVPPNVAYQDRYISLGAYAKHTWMAKLLYNIAPDHQIKFSYTANRGDDILYPSSKMDALYDDSDLYRLSYTIKNLSPFSKELEGQFYRSSVDHAMSTKYRKSAVVDSNPMMPGVQQAFMTHTLQSVVEGARIKNSFEFQNHLIKVGMDYMKRTWDGRYYKNDIPLDIASMGRMPFESINGVETRNIGLYIHDRFEIEKFVLRWGVRGDRSEVTSRYTSQSMRSFDMLGGFASLKYSLSTNDTVTLSFGRSARIPDAKELFWVGSMGNEVGTPSLRETINHQVDLDFEHTFDQGSLRIGGFYSKLQDFIAYNASSTMKMPIMGTTKTLAYHAYENVDATLWGLEAGGSWMVSDKLFLDWAVAYQKGTKDRPLSGQSDTNMPEIPPLKFNGSLHYVYDDALAFDLELIAADAWDRYDAQNGEQRLSGFGVLNFKATKYFNEHLELHIGVDNLTDAHYALTNTYKDQILLPTVQPQDTVMLMFEPGRYVYANLRYKF